MATSRQRPVTPPTPNWEDYFKQQGYIRRVNSLGIVSFTDPNDPEWRWVRDPAGSGWTRYPWYLVDQPGGRQTPTGHETRRTETGQLGREVNATAAEGPIPVIYGETRVGGDVVAHASVSAEAGNPYYCMWSLGHGELDSLQAMYLQFGATNQWLPLNQGLFPGYDYALYHFRPGSLTQTASSYAAIAHNEHIDFLGPGIYQTWPGHAYVAGRFIYNRDYLHQPPQPRFLVRGRKIYDARLDPNLATPGFTATRNGTTVVYQATASNVLADYLSDVYFGFNLGDAGLLWEEWAEAAIYCDTLVAGEKRFQFNGRISRDASPESIIEMMRAHCRAILRWRGNRLGIVINKPRASVATFTKSTAVPVRGKRAGASQVPNAGLLWWTNPSKDWNRDSVQIETENAKLGVDEVRRVEFALDNCTQPGQAARQLAYMFTEARANLDLTLAPITSDAMENEVGDRITYVEEVAGFGGSGINLMIEEISDPGQGKRFFSTSLYDEAAFSDATGVVESRVPTSLSDPYGQVGNPLTLSVTEAVDQPQPGVFVPRLVITFTPASSPYLGGTKLALAVGAGGFRDLGMFEGGPVRHILSEGAGQTVTVRAYSVNRNTGLADTGYLSYSLTTYDPANPEPIGYIERGVVGGVDSFWWAKPPIRSTTSYGAASWSGFNTSIFTAAAMNDGNLATQAAQFNNSGVGSVTLDAGSAVEMREVRITWLEEGFTPSISYSDDGTNFFAVSAWPTTIGLTVVYSWLTGGSHRYWRIAKDSTAAQAARISEVRFVSYTGTYPYARGYRLTGPNTDGVDRTVDIWFDPTNVEGKAIAVADFTYAFSTLDSYGLGSAGQRTRISVQTISPTMAVAEKRTRTSESVFQFSEANPQAFLSLQATEITPTASAVNHLTIANTPNFVRLIGATTGWTIGSLSNGYAGRLVTILNASGIVAKLLNQNSAATAANRFDIAADLSLRVGEAVTLIYDPAAQRWRPIEHRGPIAVGATFNAVDFAAASPGAWTVAAGDVSTLDLAYVGPNTLQVTMRVQATTVSGSPAFLTWALPSGLVATRPAYAAATLVESALGVAGVTASIASPSSGAGSGVIAIYKPNFAAMANTTDATEVAFQILIPI